MASSPAIPTVGLTVFPNPPQETSLATKRRHASWWGVRFFLAAFVLSAALFLSIGCTEESKPAQPNLLLISIDTLRADHLGSWGYEHDTSPFLDELAANGLHFSHAFVNTHGTPPSHTTMLTSLYQESHRVGMRPSRHEKRNDSVPEGLVMVQEMLRDAGYRTAAVTDGGYMSKTFGFHQGFDFFDDDGDGIAGGSRKMLDWLRAQKEEEEQRPVFGLLHTYEVHSPYDPPEEYRDLFGTYESDLVPTNENLTPIQDDASHLSEEDFASLRALYDGEIRYTDDVLRSFFEELETLGFFDGVGGGLVIITSDHGEEFGDHGGLLHRVSLYEELIHVPLIVYGRTRGSETIDQLVSLVDITPTFLAAAGLETTPLMAGRDLRSLPPEYGEEIFTQYTDLRYAIRTRQWKLIEWPKAKRLELYDLIADPEEQNDLSEENAGVARRLRGRLHEWRKSCPTLDDLTAKDVELSAEETQRLRDLGYLQ